MPGNAESLNVAIATSIILFEKVRQGRCKNEKLIIKNEELMNL